MKKFLSNKKFKQPIKEKISMKSNKGKSKKKSSAGRNGIVIAGIVLVLGILIYQINEEGMFVDQLPVNYQTIGPLTIDKDKYVLGENVFGYLNLHPLEVGDVTFYRPDGKSYYSINFNGSLEPSPKFYFRPNLEYATDMCTAKDIIGTWTIIITGKTLTDDKMDLTLESKEMEFKFLDKMLPGRELDFDKNACIDLDN